MIQSLFCTIKQSPISCRFYFIISFYPLADSGLSHNYLDYEFFHLSHEVSIQIFPALLSRDSNPLLPFWCQNAWKLFLHFLFLNPNHLFRSLELHVFLYVAYILSFWFHEVTFSISLSHLSLTSSPHRVTILSKFL